jgi:hypothetical protein
MSGTYNVQDAAYGGGASPAGQSDCTGAFQAALDAIPEADGGLQNSAAQAVNTTQANQLVLTAGWASDTGSPAVSCAATLLERI